MRDWQIVVQVHSRAPWEMPLPPGTGYAPFRREGLAARLLPFAAAATLGALAPLIDEGAAVRFSALVAAAGVVAVASVAAVLLAPWWRLPSWAPLLPVLGYLATLVMLRAGTAGSTLVFEPLLTLPVFWLALYHPWRHLLVGVAAVVAIVLASQALQSNAPREWPAAIFWPVAAGALGAAVHDFVARVRAQRVELEMLARTDPLTGCGNRRAWHDELEHHVALAARLGYQVTVAMLDLDRFKEWNDQRGHQAGDRLLADLVAAWETVLREVDLLARLGGDEFAVLLPGADALEAEAAVERMRALVPPPLSCSAGLTTWSGAETLTEFMARADQALYQAKRAGRDRTVVLSGVQGQLPLR